MVSWNIVQSSNTGGRDIVTTRSKVLWERACMRRRRSMVLWVVERWRLRSWLPRVGAAIGVGAFDRSLVKWR